MTCPVGGKMTGGGGRVLTFSGTQREKVALTESYPVGTTGWTATGVVHKDLTGSERMTVTTFVVCTT